MSGSRVTRLRLLDSKQPISNLPDELLAVIFKLACPCRTDDEDWLWRDMEPLRKVRGAINLTCIRWRQVSLQSAALWSSISIAMYDVLRDSEDANWRDSGENMEFDNSGSGSDGEDDEEDGSAVSEEEDAKSASSDDSQYDICAIPNRSLISLELERAGNRPLALHLRSYSHRCSKELIQLAALAISRCETVYAFLVVHGTIGAMLCEPQPLPLLRTLLLNYRSDAAPHSIVNKFVPLDLTKADSLCDLSIKSLGPRCSIQLPRSNNITTLHLDEEGPARALDLIDRCRSLASLSWDSGFDIFTTPTSAPTIQPLSHLRILHLTGSAATQHLDYFDAPGLEALVINQNVSAFEHQGPAVLGITSPFP